jgi:hypothetical protein
VEEEHGEARGEAAEVVDADKLGGLQ